MHVKKIHSEERIHALINRLTARGRPKLATRVYSHWMMRLAQDQGEDFHPTHAQLWQHGRLLREAGETEQAAQVFRALVTALNCAGERDAYLQTRSFDEWAGCLSAMGMHRSAQETRILRRRTAVRLKRAKEERGEEPRTLLPTRLLHPVTMRITFIMALEWEGPSDTFDLLEEGHHVSLRSRFRAGDPPGTWLEFEAKAPAGPDPDVPHTTLCVKYPWRFEGGDSRRLALELVNEMNEACGVCSSCLESESGQIAIRSEVVYTGYNTEVSEPLADIASAQEEATLNMFVAVISTATGWESRAAALYDGLRNAEERP